jgi:hypothetical protein
VIFIPADDLGCSDTTLYGTTRLYQTPNIERPAKRGMTFTRAYANSPLPLCRPAGILLGGSLIPQGWGWFFRAGAGVTARFGQFDCFKAGRTAGFRPTQR